MISDQEILDILNSDQVQSELSVKDSKTIEIIKIVLRLDYIEEVIDITHDFLKEVSRQVAQSSGAIMKDAINEVLSDALEDHGWLEDNETVSEEIYKKNTKK